MPLAAGSSFAGFTIAAQLGSGGMGEVYLVDHPRLPRQEALKILPPSLTADTEYRQRFVREADLAAEMWHPHIVAVHDRGEAEGQLWITMDYVAGTDVAALIRDRFPAGLPPHFAAEIVVAVADALDYAHSRNLLHRDVKPANILVSDPDPAARKRRILLSDFGIARRMDDASGLTATNMTVGSIAYAAPEQLMGRSLTGQADQYALAASAFQLLTGKTPFDNSNAAVVISSHLSAPPPAAGDRRPDLAPFDSVIARAMAKDPEHRYETCTDFAEAFAAVVEAGPRLDHSTRIATPVAKAAVAQPQTVGGTQQSATESAPQEPAESRKSVRTGVLVGAGVVAVAIAGAVGVFVLRGSDSSDAETAAASSADAPAPSSYGSPTDSALIPASAISDLLLPVAELDTMTGQQLEEASTSSTLLDASEYFERPECSPAIYPAEQAAYGRLGFTGVRQAVLQTPEGSPYYYIVDQSVVLLPSAQTATQFVADSKRVWQGCAGAQMPVTTPTGTMQITLADVADRADGIVQDRTVDDGVSPRYACQHTLAAKENLVAEAVVCADVEIGDRSQAIVDAILANVPS